ncbi:MAG: metalloregulator ArsR/SmtB family transcription factor [Pedobacter sp.]|nr:metalloregulator ArsR/SmtB family transcription factor [Pedobacter sp.]MDQ8051597.1 metalloregulator ArsR/SmtB family transcription factor [Pedobacter sp.]
MAQLDVFQVIADPSRRQILHLLSIDQLPINIIANNFEMSRPAVSKHLKILADSGFISISVKGREHYCTLNEDGFVQLKNWMDYYDNFWKTKLQHLEALMDQG